MFTHILTIVLYLFILLYSCNYNTSNSIKTNRPKEQEETGMENSAHQHVAC